MHVTGDLDGTRLAQLEVRCVRELELGCSTLVLDFTGMTSCPSAVFTFLSRVGKAYRSRSGRLELIGLVGAVAVVATGHPSGRERPSA